MLSIIHSKIIDILENNDKIAAVYDYEVEQFNESPSAVVVPSANENAYATTQQNERVYAFTIKLFVNRTKNPKGKTDMILRELVESVLNNFDSNYLLTGIEQPTGYTFINLFALPSQWGYAGREDEFRAAEINVRCRVYVDVRAIS